MSSLEKYQLRTLTETLDRVVAERDELRAALAAATARAEAAEKLRQITAAKIQELMALVDDYGSYCNRSGIEGAEPQTFTEWLAKQSEVQP